MNKDFIYINENNCRVEINMNTVEAWESMSGKTLSQFEANTAAAAGKGGVSTSDMLIWIYCAVKEGEELEGRLFEHDFAEFKRMLRPAILTRFTPIFIKQYMWTSSGNSVKEVIKRKKSIRYRLLSLFKLHTVQ